MPMVLDRVVFFHQSYLHCIDDRIGWCWGQYYVSAVCSADDMFITALTLPNLTAQCCKDSVLKVSACENCWIWQNVSGSLWRCCHCFEQTIIVCSIRCDPSEFLCHTAPLCLLAGIFNTVLVKLTESALRCINIDSGIFSQPNSFFGVYNNNSVRVSGHVR